jgi:hypothetical protein
MPGIHDALPPIACNPAGRVGAAMSQELSLRRGMCEVQRFFSREKEMDNEQGEYEGEAFFSEFPPAECKPIGIDIVRAPKGGKCSAICLSEIAWGKYTHFYRGRTQPCDGPNCRKCEAGYQRRWHSWVVVLNDATRRMEIYEVPGGAAHDLANWRRANGSLRGWPILLQRVGSRDNGRVKMVVGLKRRDPSSLPPLPDLKEILSRMWQVRGDDQIIDVFDEPKVYDADEGEELGGAILA